MKIIQLYQDYHIPYLTEGNSHCQPGWVNTDCPFCAGSKNYHLGYNLEKNYFNCWRCGGHSISSTLQKLLHISDYHTIEKIITQYNGNNHSIINTSTKIIIKKNHLKLPSNIIPLTAQQKNYLKKRKFNPKKIQKEWKIQGLGPLSKLDNIPYSYRILIPIYWDGRLVTFQARDTTGKQLRKYMACPENREEKNIKTILYGQQNKWTDTGICVEGITDVWRFGVHAFATFGIQYKHEQIKEMVKNFKQIFVCFDGNEIQAKKQANKLIAELKFRGVKSERIDINGDPGDMQQKEADKLIKKLFV